MCGDVRGGYLEVRRCTDAQDIGFDILESVLVGCAVIGSTDKENP